MILRDLHTMRCRTLPSDLPIACIPKPLRPFVGPRGTRNRRANECAVLTALRNELKRGTVWVQGSRRLRKLEAFFLPDAERAVHWQDFFHNAGLPVEPVEMAALSVTPPKGCSVVWSSRHQRGMDHGNTIDSSLADIFS